MRAGVVVRIATENWDGGRVGEGFPAVFLVNLIWKQPASVMCVGLA